MAVTTNQITITTMEGWYSGDTAPSNPLIGDLWLDTTNNEIKKWDGTNWVKQADTQGPQGPKGDSMISRVAYWIKSSVSPEPPDSETGDMKGWTKGSEPPESALNGIGASDKFWRIYKETYSNGESEYSKYSEVELIGSYEVLNGLVQFRNGVTATENGVTVIDGGKIKTGSIDAQKITVPDLRAFDATIGGFHIGDNSIYSGNKNSIDSTERGIYFDSNGQSYFGDNKNFIRFYRSDKDNYKLQISADSLTFGSGVSVEKAFEDIKGDIQNAQNTADNAQTSANQAQSTANKAQTAINNLEIGGRNLVTNSINLSDFKIESSNYTTRAILEDCCIVNRLVNHNNSGSKYGIYKDIRVTAGEEYTVSCTVKEITGSMWLGLGDDAMWVGLGEWNLSVGRFTCTVTAPSSATFIRIYIFGNDGVNGGSATVSNIKLEKGNRATDWTPAPEDVDAGIANAQTTADTAKTNAATAQSTAVEAAKTADNYISADSTGIMVSKNTGATKETPSNATKNNVLITDQDVQIRNGKKAIALYGKKTILGDLNSNNITLTSDGIVLNDGDFISAKIEATKYTGETTEDRELFWGNVADSYVRLGRTWTVTYDLAGPVGSVESVVLNGSSGDTLTIPFDLAGPYGYLRSRNSLKIHVDGTFSETKDIDWTSYITVTIVYTKQKYTAGTIICDETHNINCYAEMVEATDRMFVGKRYNLVRINDVRKIFVIGNGDLDKKSNAAAIMQNGDIRLKGTVYFGCREDSSGGKTIVDLIYPVGSIYMSVNSTDPSTLFGGSWERIQDTFLLASGSTYGAGTTGGSAKATLPSHTHTFGSGGYQMWGAKIGTGSTEPGNQISGDAKYYAAVKGKSTSNYKWLESVDSKGMSDVSQANMPPYLAVYVWKRIS